MKRLLLSAAALALAVPAFARAEGTWKGTITDSMCGTKHAAAKHGDNPGEHRACVERCITRGGEYVLVSGEKVYKIANQKFDGLKAHAGHEVTVTGDLKDETLTVSKIEMPKAEKK